MIFEHLQLFLQYLERPEQTTGHFYLPDVLSKPYRRNLKLPETRKRNYRLDCFRLDISSYLYGGEGFSPTGMLATLNLMRTKYFNGIHTSTVDGSTSMWRIYLKIMRAIY